MTKEVKKRDGSIEPYEEEKVIRVVMAAGLSEDKARTLSAEVTQWINMHSDQVVSSLVIRDKILDLLTAADSSVADLFRWYQKTKETSNPKIVE